MRILVVHNNYGLYSGEEAVVDRMIDDGREAGHIIETLRLTSEGSRDTFTGKVDINICQQNDEFYFAQITKSYCLTQINFRREVKGFVFNLNADFHSVLSVLDMFFHSVLSKSTQLFHSVLSDIYTLLASPNLLRLNKT